MAPKNGIETTTITDAIPFIVAINVSERWRSETIHTEKNSVVMFIENTVFANS